MAVGFWFLILIPSLPERLRRRLKIKIKKPEDLTAAFNHTRKRSRGALDSRGLLILLSRRNPERSRI